MSGGARIGVYVGPLSSRYIDGDTVGGTGGKKLFLPGAAPATNYHTNGKAKETRPGN